MTDKLAEEMYHRWLPYEWNDWMAKYKHQIIKVMQAYHEAKMKREIEKAYKKGYAKGFEEGQIAEANYGKSEV